GVYAWRAGRTATGALIWSTPATDTTAVAEAVGLAEIRGLRTVTVSASDVPLSRRLLAVAFAAHLNEIRTARQMSGVCVTAAERPEVRPGWVRLSHLLTGACDDGPRDTVVWELMPAAAVPRWLGAPLPDRPFFEEHLPE